MMHPTRARWAIVVLWGILVLASLPVREVMTPDEARFTQQAQEMRESGQWFVPSIGGVPNADKPPVLFWSINLAAVWQSRIGEAVARLPSAIGSLVVLLLTFRMGRRLWGRTDVGLLAALLLLTNFQFWHRSQWVSCDMLLVAFSWVALTLWREALFEPGSTGMSPRAKIALGWLAASIGVMTKGLGLFWPLFWVAGEAWARRSWRPLRRLVQPSGLFLFVAPLAAWLTMFAMGAGLDKLNEAMFQQTVNRYVSAWNLVKPWYFYAHQLPVNLLPWTVFLPLVAMVLWKHRRGRGSDDADATGMLAAFGFVAIAVVFFSFSSGKRGVYLLPAQPALALLLARSALELGRAADLGRRSRAWAYAALGLLGTLPGVVIPWLVISGRVPALNELKGSIGTDWILPTALGGVALIVASVIACAMTLRRREPRRALQVASAGMALLLLALGTFGGRAVSRRQGAAAFGAEIARAVPEDDRIAIVRGKFELFLYYSERLGTEWESAEQLHDALFEGGCRYVLMTSDRYRKLSDREFVAELVPRLGGTVSDRDYVLLEHVATP